MTLEYDFIQLDTLFFGKVRITLKSCGMEWPPPEIIISDSTGNLYEAEEGDNRREMFQRYSMSALTDEQAEKCPNVARGAAYGYMEPHDVDMGHG